MLNWWNFQCLRPIPRELAGHQVLDLFIRYIIFNIMKTTELKTARKACILCNPTYSIMRALCMISTNCLPVANKMMIKGTKPK